MKTNRILVLVIILLAAVGFTAGAAGINLLADAPAAATPPLLGQPGSLIEVYGVIDAALRLETNDSFPSQGAAIGMGQGLFQGSRLGFRGTEGLFGSFKAIYDLEIGLVPPYGVIDQQGQIFGRQAWIGVSSDYGRLTVGRVYGTFSDAIGAGDVFGVNHGNAVYPSNANGTQNAGSNDAVNGFFQQEMGLRWDDSIKYEANFNGVTVGAMATLGGIPNEFLYNSMFGASLGYNSKDLPVSGSIAIQGENDVNNNHHWDVGAGVKYALDATDGVYAFYIHSVFDSGFARIAYSDSEMGKAGAGTGFGRTDDIINVAVNYYIMPSLNLIAAYYWDNALNVNAAADDGSRDSILLVADYYFTKDFDVYLAGWYTIFNGALEYTIYGGDNAVPDGTGYQFNAPPTWATGNTPSAFTCELGVRFRF